MGRLALGGRGLIPRTAGVGKVPAGPGVELASEGGSGAETDGGNGSQFSA